MSVVYDGDLLTCIADVIGYKEGSEDYSNLEKALDRDVNDRRADGDEFEPRIPLEAVSDAVYVILDAVGEYSVENQNTIVANAENIAS